MFSVQGQAALAQAASARASKNGAQGRLLLRTSARASYMVRASPVWPFHCEYTRPSSSSRSTASSADAVCLAAFTTSTACMHVYQAEICMSHVDLRSQLQVQIHRQICYAPWQPQQALSAPACNAAPFALSLLHPHSGDHLAKCSQDSSAHLLLLAVGEQRVRPGRQQVDAAAAGLCVCGLVCCRGGSEVAL